MNSSCRLPIPKLYARPCISPAKAAGVPVPRKNQGYPWDTSISREFLLAMEDLATNYSAKLHSCLASGCQRLNGLWPGQGP